MSKESQDICVERHGTRGRVEPEAATVTPDAAFVATVLDGGPNISPAREAAQVVVLSEAAYRSAEQGRIVEMGRLTAT